MPGAADDEKTKNKGRGKGDDDGDGGDGEDDDDKPLTAKQVNAAITKAVRSVERRMSKTFTDTLSKTFADAGLGKKPPTDDTDDDDGDDDEAPAAKAPKTGAAAADAPPARKGKSKAERELAKLKADMEAMKATAEAEKAKAQRSELKRATTDLLNAAGVRKEAVPLLVTHLLSEDGGRRIRLNDDGQAVFVMGDGDDADEMPLKEGVSAWAKTDEGKAYLAPKQAGGSAAGQVPGMQARTPGQPARTATDNGAAQVQQQNRDLFAAVMNDMGGFVFDTGAPNGQ